MTNATGVEVIRKGNEVTRLTVTKVRVSIKLAKKDDSPEIIDALIKIGADLQDDEGIRVSMRGALEGTTIVMEDDLKAISRRYTL